MAWVRTEQDEAEADILKRYGNTVRTWGMAMKRLRITDSELASYRTGFHGGVRCIMHSMAKDLRMSDDEFSAIEAAAERMADLCQAKEATPGAATPKVTVNLPGEKTYTTEEVDGLLREVTGGDIAVNIIPSGKRRERVKLLRLFKILNLSRHRGV